MKFTWLLLLLMGWAAESSPAPSNSPNQGYPDPAYQEQPFNPDFEYPLPENPNHQGT